MLGRESNSAEAKTVSKLRFLPALRGFSVMREGCVQQGGLGTVLRWMEPRGTLLCELGRQAIPG